MLLIMVLPALAGCVFLDPTRPFPAGARVSPYGSERPGDAGAAPSGPLTLGRAIAIALGNNPEIAAAGHDLETARGQRGIAASQAYPSVHVAAGHVHHQDPQRLAPAGENGESGVFGRDLVSGDLTAGWPVFTGGRILGEVRAADHLLEAAGWRAERLRQELIFEVTRVFLGILSSRHVIESLEFSRDALEKHLERVEALVAARKAPEVDRLRTEVRLGDVRQKLVQARNLRDIQIRVLANLLGGATEGGDFQVVGNLEIAPEGALGSVEGAVQLAETRRSDLRAAESALKAMAARVDAARAGHWPTVWLQGAWGVRSAPWPTERPHGAAPWEDAGRIGIAVDFPLFDGGRIEARVREQKAALRAAAERCRSLALKVRLEVETAFLGILSSRERVSALRKAVEQAEEALRIEREKYDLGKGTIVDVLDAQSALLDSQTSLYRALAEHATALVQLRLATGEP